MKKLILYRGINCLEASSKGNIQANGIIGTEGTVWELYFRDMIKPLIDINLKDLSDSDKLFVDSTSRAICACGDELSASYYACIHNSGNFPLVVKFQTTLENIYIDGRDLLYTVFQLWDMNNSNNFARIRQQLNDLFGSSILHYFDHCENEKDHTKRIIYCNYACHDNEVKLAHLKNQIIIKGRYKTLFKSAFIVKSPISKEDILDVFTPACPSITPGITLENLRS
jgi:hypothetical protein